MTDTQFSDHLSNDISQVRTVIDVRYQHFIFFIHVIPIHAVHVLGVKEITHLPPTFIINLHPFLMVINHFFHTFRGNRTTHASRDYRKIHNLERGTGKSHGLFITGSELNITPRIGFSLSIQIIHQRAASPVIVYPVAQHVYITIIIRCQHRQFY